MKNSIAFRLWGKYALFSDPVTRIGGEKCSYHVPTYESLRGIARSIYWKPTFVWRIDKVRIMKPIRTQTKSVKPLNYTGGNSLAFYNYLSDVEYHVLAHFEWNEHASQLECDRNATLGGSPKLRTSSAAILAISASSSALGSSLT